jgi:dTDP-4-amino-4,6-dideoxygalactose transaminase
MNSRLDELQAALLMERLPALAAATGRRRTIAAALHQALSNPGVRLLAAPEETTAHVHHLFVLTCDKRDALQAHLQAQGVQSLIHYPVPVHHQPPCAGVAIDPRGMAATEAHAATCLSIPCAPHLTDANVDQMIEAINSFARSEA